MRMSKIDGFQTTDSFRFDRNTSTSSTSLSSSSGYGSRLSLSSSSNHRYGLSKYFKEKLSRHKSLVSLVQTLSSSSQTETDNIYDHVWNLDEQIEKLRSNIQKHFPNDSQSIISMSVDSPATLDRRVDDHDLLSVAAWYQEGLSENICEEYLSRDNQPIGSFIIRCCFERSNQSFILSMKTKRTTIEHIFIQKLPKKHAYRIEGSSKMFINLSTLVLHHTIMKENLPVPLVLPLVSSSSVNIRSVRF